MRKSIVRPAVLALAGLFTFQPLYAATTNNRIVSPQQLKQAARDSVAASEANRQTVRGFFATERAQKALKQAGIDSRQIDRAVAQMSDEEAAGFASRVTQAENDFAGGALSNQEITYILIALATAVIVLILV